MDSALAKQRVEPVESTERTPLLASPNLEAQSAPHDAKPPNKFRSHVVTTLLSLFSALLFVVLVLSLLVSSITRGAPALHGPADQIIAQGVSWQLHSVDVAEVREDGVEVTVGAHVSVNTDHILGLDNRTGPSWWNGLRKAFVHLGTRNLESITLHLSTISVSSTAPSSPLLFNVSAEPLTVPVRDNKPHPMSVTFLITPSRNATDLITFADRSWQNGAAEANIEIRSAMVQGGPLYTRRWDWRRLVSVQKEEVKSVVSIKIPRTIPKPGEPHPGNGSSFPALGSLLDLHSFSLTSNQTKDGPNDLAVEASATLKLPVTLPPSVLLRLPSKLPAVDFLISLLPPSSDTETSPFDVAHVTASPYISHNRPAYCNFTIDLPISGRILPLQFDKSPLLSNLISSYLSQHGFPIRVAAIDAPAPIPEFPPIRAEFPPPKEKPDVLRNVRIQNFQLTGESTTSGTIYADVVLPKELKSIGPLVNVSKALPDVIMYDGEPLPAAEGELPANAFANIKPDDWLPAITLPPFDHPSPENEGKRIVRIDFEDVPFKILPGRQKIFEGFVQKVIFGKGPALAGLRGHADVGVSVKGVTRPGQDAVVRGIPFQGKIFIGKKTMMNKPWLPKPKWIS